MIIDFHTHCFPEKIAAAALKKLSKASGNPEPFHAGSHNDLIAFLDSKGIDKAVVLNIATNPKQQKNVNDFASSLLEYESLIPFGSVHPDSPDAVEELYRIKEMGLKGVKFHPDYQNFFVDEERMFPLYKKISELGLITVFHAGVDIGVPGDVHCTPDRLANALPVFQSAPVVAAHMGGWLMWPQVLEKLVGLELYFDTSFSFNRMPPYWAHDIIKAHGAEKILLGSDMPWSATDNEIRFIDSLDLDENERELILSKNAEKLLF